MTTTYKIKIALVATVLLVVPTLLIGARIAFAESVITDTSENLDGGSPTTTSISPTSVQTTTQTPTLFRGVLDKGSRSPNANKLPKLIQKDLQNRSVREQELRDTLRKDARDRQEAFRDRARRIRSEMEDRAKEGTQRFRNENKDTRDKLRKYVDSKDIQSGNKRENFLKFRREAIDKRTKFVEKIKKDKEDIRTRVKGMRGDIRREKDVFQREIQSRKEKIREALSVAKTPEDKKSILEEARKEGAVLRKEALKKRDEFRSRTKVLREKFKTQREELKSEMKTEVAKRIKGRLENMLGRISDALLNFTDILGRVNNAITALNANGVDTTAATTASLTAEKAISDASLALANVRSVFDTTLSSINPKDQIKELRSTVKDAIVAVKDARTALAEAIQILKRTMHVTNEQASENNSSSTATSTTTVTSTSTATTSDALNNK